jgi:hypothetical protein
MNLNGIAPGMIDAEIFRADRQEESHRTVLWPRIGVREEVTSLGDYPAPNDADFVTDR